jgi:hypothetical protein
MWNRPSWKSDNWVEIWDGSGWSFTTPGSWTAQGFNHTSFFPDPVRRQIPRNHSYFIWASSWAPTPDGYMPSISKDWEPLMHVFDVTESYLDAAARVPAARELPDTGGVHIESVIEMDTSCVQKNRTYYIQYLVRQEGVHLGHLGYFSARPLPKMG